MSAVICCVLLQENVPRLIANGQRFSWEGPKLPADVEEPALDATLHVTDGSLFACLSMMPSSSLAGKVREVGKHVLGILFTDSQTSSNRDLQQPKDWGQSSAGMAHTALTLMDQPIRQSSNSAKTAQQRQPAYMQTGFEFPLIEAVDRRIAHELKSDSLPPVDYTPAASNICQQHVRMVESAIQCVLEHQREPGDRSCCHLPGEVENAAAAWQAIQPAKQQQAAVEEAA